MARTTVERLKQQFLGGNADMALKDVLEALQDLAVCVELSDLLQQQPVQFLTACSALGDASAEVARTVLAAAPDPLGPSRAVVASFADAPLDQALALMTWMLPRDPTAVALAALHCSHRDAQLTRQKLRQYLASASPEHLVPALDCLFPLFPDMCGPIYMSEAAKNAMMQIQSSHPDSVLRLVCSSAISEQCRAFSAENYADILATTAARASPELAVLAALALTKIWPALKAKKVDVTLDDLYSTAVQHLDNPKLSEFCIETLAFLTLVPQLRTKVRADVSFLERLLALPRGPDLDPGSYTYGLLTIIANLTKLPENGTKAHPFAAVGAPKTEDTKENAQDIHNFNKWLLQSEKLIDKFSKLKVPKSNESRNINQLVRVIYAISSNSLRSVRSELIKQGSLNIVLDFLVNFSTVKEGETRPKSNNEELVDTRLVAIRAACKMLIAVDPSLAFSKYSSRTVLPFLIELLGPNISKYTGLKVPENDSYLYDKVTSFDKYEALLALTNLASTESDREDLKDNIITKTFDNFLDNFIIDSDVPQVQLAAWELISNLIFKPKMLVKFFDDNPQAQKRLEIMVKLLDSKDVKLQEAICGLLANATSEFDMIAALLVQKQPQVIETCVSILMNQSTDKNLVTRVTYLLLNLVYADPSNTLFQQSELKAGLLKSLKENHELQEVIREIIKIV